MKLFGCCKQFESGIGYQLTSKVENKKSSVSFYKNYAEIKRDQLKSQDNSIIKLIKSDYQKIDKQYAKKDKKWTDFSFPPNDQSLGIFENISSNKWKRISEIVENPIILSQSAFSFDSSYNSYSDKVFLASVSALSEQPERIKNIFGDLSFNKNGFYRINLRVKSEIQEILIDDFVPVDENGSPLFAKPSQDQIAFMLFQKARAKVYGSYENLFNSKLTPKQILEEINFAPSERLKVPNVVNGNETQKFWKFINNQVSKKRTIIVKTNPNQQIDWKTINLIPNNYYSLIDCTSLKNTINKDEKILKLRNLTGFNEVKSSRNDTDNQFWKKIEQSEEKNRFLESHNANNEVFSIQYNDLLCYFSELIVNYAEKNGSYVNQELFYNLKNGIIQQVEVFNEGFYTFSVDHQLEQKDDGWARTSLLLIRKFCINAQSEYQFVDGTLNVNQSTAFVKHHLKPGTYLVYSKIRPTLQKLYSPINAHLIVYSQYNVKIETVPQKNHPDFLKKTFLSHARNNKRQNFNDDLMWMSWKLFNQGGYGYVAFGNDKDSHNKFIVTFNQEDFTSQGLRLKKPFKGKGQNQTIQVNPGQQVIILLTVGNSINKNRKFPPKLRVKIHPQGEIVAKVSSKSSRNIQEPIKQ